MKFAVLTFIGAAALLMAATTTRAIPASVAQNMRRGKEPPPYDEPGIIHLFFFSFDSDYSSGDLAFGYRWAIFNVDTARTDTWVLDENCNVACPEPFYFPEDSKTYKKIGDNFTLDYIDINGPLTLSGSLGTEDAYYGDAISGVTVKGVTFGIVNKATRKLPLVEYTGVLGLGRQAKSQNGAPSFLSLAAKQHAIKRESFGLRLNRLNTTVGVRLGMATLGGVENEYTKGLQYHSLPPKSDAWELSLTDVLFNGASLGYKRTALFDSTSWTIRVPEKDAEAIYKKIPGSKRLENGLYEIPRDSKVVITLQFDDQKYSMKASDMCYQYPDKGTTCNAAIQANDSKDVWTIGHPFLVNVYTVFDNVDKRIGFARGDF